MAETLKCLFGSRCEPIVMLRMPKCDFSSEGGLTEARDEAEAFAVLSGSEHSSLIRLAGFSF